MGNQIGSDSPAQTMDMASILVAMHELYKHLSISNWQSNHAQRQTDPHRMLIELYRVFYPEIADLQYLTVKVSTMAAELNQLLIDRKFDPMFREMDPVNEVGVVAIIDMLVKWAGGPATEVSINARYDRGQLPGFELPAQMLDVYTPGRWSNQPKDTVIRINTEVVPGKVPVFVWLYVPEQIGPVHDPSQPFALFNLATQLESRVYSGELSPTDFDAVRVPMVYYRAKPDLTWLLDLGFECPTGHYKITQAGQQSVFGFDPTGAIMKIATGVGVTRSLSSLAKRYFTIDRPFYFWFTQGNSLLPIGPTYTGWETLQRPPALDTL